LEIGFEPASALHHHRIVKSRLLSSNKRLFSLKKLLPNICGEEKLIGEFCKDIMTPPTCVRWDVNVIWWRYLFHTIASLS
jgi:hypothetical protein